MKGSKATNTLLNKKSTVTRERSCIWCGRCLESCGAHLMPAMLVRYAKAGMCEDCRRFYIDYCVGCAACVYVCPAKIPILKYIGIARQELAKKAAEE